mgnify:CR=1 FL=1
MFGFSLSGESEKEASVPRPNSSSSRPASSEAKAPEQDVPQVAEEATDPVAGPEEEEEEEKSYVPSNDELVVPCIINVLLLAVIVLTLQNSGRSAFLYRWVNPRALCREETRSQPLICNMSPTGRPRQTTRLTAQRPSC